MPQRGRLSNKSNGGRVLVIAGSQNMMGAALLAARASLRAGAGYVTVMPVLPESAVRDYNSLKNNPEVLWKVFDLNQDWNQFDAILIGPGLGFEAEDPIKKLIQSLLNINYPWVILDADALTICSRNFQDQKFPSTWVITPHDAEMAKLIPRSIQNIQESRLECLRAAVKKWNATFVLKGSRSLIASQNKVFVNLSGNSALAKSGTGDVLSGIILAMLAQMKDVAQATCLSVYVHGRISDEFVREGKDHLSLLPTDLIEKLPQVLFDIRKGQVQNTRIQNGKNK